MRMHFSFITMNCIFCIQRKTNSIEQSKIQNRIAHIEHQDERATTKIFSKKKQSN